MKDRLEERRRRALFEIALHEHMEEFAEACREVNATPLLMIAIDGAKQGHLLWPEDLPQEMVDAFPALLEDALENLRTEPPGKA